MVLMQKPLPGTAQVVSFNASTVHRPTNQKECYSNKFIFMVYTVPPTHFSYCTAKHEPESNPGHACINGSACDVPARPRLHIVMQSLNPLERTTSPLLDPECVIVYLNYVCVCILSSCSRLSWPVLYMFIMRRMCVWVMKGLQVDGLCCRCVCVCVWECKVYGMMIVYIWNMRSGFQPADGESRCGLCWIP